MHITECLARTGIVLADYLDQICTLGIYGMGEASSQVRDCPGCSEQLTNQTKPVF
jgi:hypothetical protein